MRLSVVVEWANTRLNGAWRADVLLERLNRQWKEIVDGNLPPDLTESAAGFLRRLERRVELIAVSGEAIDNAVEQRIRGTLSGDFDVAIHVAPDLEYYALKNFGASLASGDLLLFVDSDVLPEDGWLAHLLGTFARADVHVVTAQTYVAPTDLVARAFALGWTYSLRDETGALVQPAKFYANTIVFRAEVFRRTGFRPLGRRSRGACSLLRQDLDALGIAVWENRMARVDHPPPSSLRHLVVRALAHGRDHYMKRTEARSWDGLKRGTRVSAERLARAFRRTFEARELVGLKLWEVPAALALITSYYGFFALGAVLTHIHPEAMSRRFRV